MTLTLARELYALRYFIFRLRHDATAMRACVRDIELQTLRELWAFDARR